MRSEDAPEGAGEVEVELDAAVASAFGDLEAEEVEEGLQRDADARIDAVRLESEWDGDRAAGAQRD